MLTIQDWGRTPYAEALERQKALVELRVQGLAGDTLVFTEHEPVFTIGLRSGAEQHLVWDSAALQRQGVSVATTNRGGDITYHGPGQIVGYPVMDISARKDLHAYLRFLEEVLIAAVARHGLTANRRDGLTGIWIGSRKVAAIGVAVRRWVTYHGFALNVSPDLTHFTGIIPCGISASDGTVTSLAQELGSACPTVAAVRATLTEEFERLHGVFLTVK
ncbi:lipoyl(octanoyl) transferase LipB [Nibricoccus sp. IMCC34717]|uniref:lipoyl(octanoyl) transferase LipB n=1 Tax=Nibricoccus sp. IMCC34717 TaxID=3034021 RepID=UPI00384D4945